MPTSNARVVFFDLGNVLAFFDHERVVINLERLLHVDRNRLREVVFGSGLQSRYESGQLDSASFCRALRGDIPVPDHGIADQDLLDACSDIFWLNHEIVPVVAHLAAAGHRLGILSNTCDGHWRWLTRGNIRILPGLFPLRVLSYEVRSMKPGPEIYQQTVRCAGVPAGEIFFVDDRPENVEGALQAGLDARLYQGVPTLVRDLLQRGIAGDY